MHTSKFILAEFLVSIFFIFFLACNAEQTTVEVTKLPEYPSGSGIEYYNNRYYLIGDDATQLLQLDQNFKVTDSIELYHSAQKRIPKNIKPDLEAITLVKENGADRLLLIGSGSLTPYRDIAWLINPGNGRADSIRLDSFYKKLMKSGIPEINIEGACNVGGTVILSNRGHKGWRVNCLFFISQEFWKDSIYKPMRAVNLGGNVDTAVFNGVSGLCYAEKNDCLILTVSTEDTKSSYEDGAIGKSYIWIIKNVLSKKDQAMISPDLVIDLESIDPRFKGQKIESACVTGETGKTIKLALAADNDDGSSTVFKISISAKN